jgi:4-aminobutyrate aminotransferase
MVMKSEDIYRREEQAIGQAMKIRLFPLVTERANGTRVYDPDGREYLDFSANWAVANTGYCHPEVVKAVCEQVAKNTFSSHCTVITEPAVELAERLIALAPGDFEKRVWFGLSGSDANDCVSKLFPLATGRSRLISFFGAYHGQTMGSLSLSGHTAQARFIGQGNVTKIPYPYCYRCPFGRERETCGLLCLDYLENWVFKSVSPPEDTAAVLVEAIQCDGGDVPAPDGYHHRLKAICEKHGILFVVDEVKVGFGRTGKMFGIEHYGVVPDAIVFGKPVASGLPLSGVIAPKAILDGSVATHLFTTAGNPISAAAGLATLDIINRENLPANAARMGEYLVSKLKEMASRVALIGDVRGKGLVIGVELVKDRGTKEPASLETAKAVYQAYKHGLVVFYVGLHSNVLEITPPLTLSRADADEGLEKLEAALGDVEAGRVSEEEVARFAGW